MVAITYDDEFMTRDTAENIFNGFLLPDTLIRQLPPVVKSVEILEGDGGIGTVRVVQFGEGSDQVKSVKHRVDAIDKENLTHTFSIFGGDAITDVLESITYHIRLIDIPGGGGSVCAYKSIYNTKGDDERNEERIEFVRTVARALLEAIEFYVGHEPTSDF